MADETFKVCPYCNEPVDPDAPGVVYARERVDVPGSRQTHDWIDGTGAYFHPNCSPDLAGYVRRPRPE